MSKVEPTSIVFLAVPDGAVRGLASQLTGAPGSVSFVHLSGAMGLDPLKVLWPGHAVGSFHPLQSFPAPRAPSAFQGSTIAVDASSGALLRRLRALARAIGGRPKQVGDADRVLYHAAAVFASNYLTVVVAEATRLLEGIGWTRAESTDALLPLIEGAVANLRARGPVHALTGPVRRGDAETVARQLAALEKVDAADGYRMLGTIALKIAREAGLDPAAAERMHRALTHRAAATQRRRRK